MPRRHVTRESLPGHYVPGADEEYRAPPFEVATAPAISQACARPTSTSSSCPGPRRRLRPTIGTVRWESEAAYRAPGWSRRDWGQAPNLVGLDRAARRGSRRRRTRPIVLVAHSLGVVSDGARPPTASRTAIVGAFLVAPPSAAAPARRSKADRPGLRRGDDGRRCRFPPCSSPAAMIPIPHGRRAKRWRKRGACRSRRCRRVGPSSTTSSGHGPWPEGLMRFAGFPSRACPDHPEKLMRDPMTMT